MGMKLKKEVGILPFSGFPHFLGMVYSSFYISVISSKTMASTINPIKIPFTKWFAFFSAAKSRFPFLLLLMILYV